MFLYPHSVTGLLAARSRDTIRRNMAALPAYSFLLGLLAMSGGPAQLPVAIAGSLVQLAPQPVPLGP